MIDERDVIHLGERLSQCAPFISCLHQIMTTRTLPFAVYIVDYGGQGRSGWVGVLASFTHGGPRVVMKARWVLDQTQCRPI